MPTVRKSETIEGLSELLDKSLLLVLTEYRGMSVAEVTDLRKQLRPAGAEYHVTKNTLLRIAAQRKGLPSDEALMSGPTAVTFVGEDLVGGAKAILNYAKNSKNFVIKGGILQGQVIKANDLDDITKLPSKQELVSQMLGSLQSPVYGLVNVLAATPRNLVNVINAPLRDLSIVLQQRQAQLEKGE
jgi:large subunit ribosomal protein L10